MPKRTLFKVGQKIDDYRLEKYLGGGEDGEVWQAVKLSLDRKCAIKFLKTADDLEKNNRFLKEIELLAHLHHPSIVSIEDKGEAWNPTTEQTAPYYVMEFIEGPPVAVAIEQVPPRERLEALCIIFQQVLSALRTVHAKGVSHGDIKSGNILVLQDLMIAKLSDFGFALSANQQSNRKVYPGSSYKAPPGLSPMKADVYRLGMTIKDCAELLPKTLKDDESRTLNDLIHSLTSVPPSISVEDALLKFKALQRIVAAPYMEIQTPDWRSQQKKGAYPGDTPINDARAFAQFDLKLDGLGSFDALPQGFTSNLPYLLMYYFFALPVQGKCELITGVHDYSLFQSQILPVMINLFVDDVDSVPFHAATVQFLSYILSTQHRYFHCLEKQGLVKEVEINKRFGEQLTRPVTISDFFDNSRSLCRLDGSKSEEGLFQVILGEIRRRDMPFNPQTLVSLRNAIVASYDTYLKLGEVLALYPEKIQMPFLNPSYMIAEFMEAFQHICRAIALCCAGKATGADVDLYAGISHLRRAILDTRKRIVTTFIRNSSQLKISSDVIGRALRERQLEILGLERPSPDKWHLYKDVVDEVLRVVLAESTSAKSTKKKRSRELPIVTP